MKLTNKDLQDACEYIIDEVCKAAYGNNYKERGYYFDRRTTPNTIRETVDLFIEWLQKRAKEKKNDIST